jgi:hypothetical protein
MFIAVVACFAQADEPCRVSSSASCTDHARVFVRVWLLLVQPRMERYTVVFVDFVRAPASSPCSGGAVQHGVVLLYNAPN